MAQRRLEYLRGISDDECARLRAAGVGNTTQLVHRTTLIGDRDRLSQRTGISADRLLALGGQARLMSVSGIDPFMRAVVRLGITDVRDLGRQDPGELHQQLVGMIGYAGAPPLSDVQYWVSQARYLDMVELPEGATAAERRRRWVSR